MGEKWRPNVAYGPAGTKVEYEGNVYELIQPHTSQMGWEPTQTPALWRLSRDQSHHSSGDHHHSSSGSKHEEHHSSHHDDHKHDDHKHSHHDDHKHEEKPQEQPQAQVPEPVHQQQQPQEQQQQQQQQQQQPQYSGIPYKWVAYTGSMPADAVAISNSLGKTFCVARGGVEGGIHPGYCDPAKNRCYTSYNRKEVVCEKFEVLTCPQGRYHWVRTNSPQNINGNPIIGGNEKDQTPLYCCKIDREGVPYFGKTSPVAQCAYYGFDDKEFKVNDFEVLCFN